MTDYLSFRSLLTIFEKDKIGPSLQEASEETHQEPTLVREKVCEEDNHRVLKTVFIRTKLDFITNFSAVFLLNLFGA